MMRSGLLRVTAVFAALSLLGVYAAQSLTYPATKTVPVTDTYFGTVVADPYRWLVSVAG